MQTSNVDLSSVSMLVSLNSTGWSARRVDRKITRDVHKRHAISEKSGRYNKCIIDVEAPTFVANQQVRQEGRSYLYKHTLPWAQDGSRILPSSSYMEFQKGMGEIESRVREADQAFLEDYPGLKAQAKIDLNGAYDESDYPSQQALAEKFEFRVVYMPMPQADDFRVNLSGPTVEAIKSRLQDDLERATNDAMRKLWERLYEPVKHMAAQFSNKNGKVYDTHVSNIVDICNLLPNLNLTNDQRLEELRLEVLKNLTRPAAVIRSSDAVKADLAKKAKAIADKMSAFMGD